MIESASSSSGWPFGTGSPPGAGGAETTGRHVVVFAEDDTGPEALLSDVAGLSSVASSREFGAEGMDMAQATGADATYFAELGIAVVSADTNQLAALQTAPAAQGRVLSVSPELVHHVLAESGDYVRGYRDGITDLASRLVDGAGAGAAAVRGGGSGVRAQFSDNDAATWGLQATRVTSSARSGAGIKVAVLDTGMDLQHPDFAGRAITSKSFIDGVATAQDGHGHGTHCIGTSCGPKDPDSSRRYGIAHGADIFVGKVLSDQGSGSDSGILAGIDWAITNGVAVISMSLGADIPHSHPPYNQAGRRALNRGTLIIAAAGNNAQRPNDPGFVGAPANSPGIIAVAAADSALGIAFFSARSTPNRGGQVDVAGPGVDVYSSWPMPKRYNTISGTSMATPHAAGIAALWAEASGQRGIGLWGALLKELRRMPLPSFDVGGGLVTAAQ